MMKKALFQRAMCLVLTVATLLTGLGFTASAGALKDADLAEGEESIYTTLEEMKALVSTSAYATYIEDYEYLKSTQSGLSTIVVDIIGSMQPGSSGVRVSERTSVRESSETPQAASAVHRRRKRPSIFPLPALPAGSLP